MRERENTNYFAFIYTMFHFRLNINIDPFKGILYNLMLEEF